MVITLLLCIVGAAVALFVGSQMFNQRYGLALSSLGAFILVALLLTGHVVTLIAAAAGFGLMSWSARGGLGGWSQGRLSLTGGRGRGGRSGSRGRGQQLPRRRVR
jgi:hypothetical protein